MSIDDCFGKRPVQPGKPVEATFQQGVHATAVQQEQSDCKLAKIVAVGADGEPACAAQRVGRLSLQWRSLTFHKLGPRRPSIITTSNSDNMAHFSRRNRHIG
ncbi:hypothetical protein CWO90_23820 [Bradyrhizobium sp. Leo121]|nr:hypothetical protein CWO90_23820 [Bradyrhizobium sp. Leo121]